MSEHPLFDAFKDEVLEDPNVKAAYNAVRAVRQLTGLRAATGMTQKQVAEKMRVKQPAISQFERETHDPRISTLLRYAAAIGVSIDIVISQPAPLCGLCEHALHHDDDCVEIVGYDHMNGDHECGCPGSTGEEDETHIEPT